MWNYIYTPAEYGPFLPVSRAWNFVKGNPDLTPTLTLTLTLALALTLARARAAST